VKTLFAIIIISLSFQAFGAPTNVRVTSGVSAVIGEPITQVWGAMVGPSDNTRTDAYNSCIEIPDAVNTFEGCNPQRVNGSTIINIQFTETDDLGSIPRAPVALVRRGAGGGGTTTGEFKPIGTINQQQARSGSNQTGTLTFTWGDLCRALVNSENEPAQMDEGTAGINRCVDAAGNPVSGALQITYGFQTTPGAQQDTTSNTILSFYLYSPGPETGFIPKACDASPNRFGFCDITPFPSDSGATLNAPDGFFEESENRSNKLVSGPSANIVGRGVFADASNTNLPLSIEKIRLYFSTLDWSSAHPYANSEQFVELLLDTTNSTTTADCPDYAVTPSEISGLITDSSCFITSATFGSPQAHQVTLFRKFRSKYMWPNTFGRFIARRYNKYGPAGARWVYQNPSSKKYVRVALMPFYGFAYLSVHFSFALAAFTYLFSLVVIVLGFKKIFSKGILD